MTAHSSLAPAAGALDYAYEMQVHAPFEQVLEALTDGPAIGRWWTAVTGSERDGDDVRLYIGDHAPFVFFTLEHEAGSGDIAWNVTDCAVMADWVGTTPTFSVRSNADGSCTVAFRHAGLGPALPCFDQCRAGWNHFMPSLHQFLETGVGRPNQPRDASS